jgi:predicted transglutaminase-like cysteine proteinase
MTNKSTAAVKYSTVTLVAAGLVITSSIAASAAADGGRNTWPAFTVVVDKADKEGPPGWAEFCHNYKSECDVESSEPRRILLTPEVMNKLAEVNRWANAHIRPVDDKKHWGHYNRWYFADDGKGDCKDYVLVKRRMLIQSGLPREALLITVVWTPRDNGHAILIVRTDKGDYVLDSLTSKIVLWKETPYDYVMRQSQSNPNVWLYIDGDPLKPTAIADQSITENPLNEPLVMITGLDEGKPKQEVIAASNIGRQQAEQQASRAGSTSAR